MPFIQYLKMIQSWVSRKLVTEKVPGNSDSSLSSPQNRFCHRKPNPCAQDMFLTEETCSNPGPAQFNPNPGHDPFWIFLLLASIRQMDPKIRHRSNFVDLRITDNSRTQKMFGKIFGPGFEPGIGIWARNLFWRICPNFENLVPGSFLGEIW